MTRLAFISAVLLSAAFTAAQTAPQPPARTTTSTSTVTKRKSTTTKTSNKKPFGKHAKPEPVKVEAPPPPPPPPPTLAQQAPVPPRVTFQNGLLSIDAPNSTLGDILSGIRRATGATVEGPVSSSDRMVVHLGPGEPRQIVSSLLSSSRFDYIVMSSPQQPNGINRLVLMARQGSPSSPVSVAGAPNAAVQQQRPSVVANTDDEEEEAPERDEDNSQPVVAQPAPEQQQQQQPQQLQQYTGQPMPPDQNAPQQGQQDQQQQANPNQPKTPEELYKELQNLERQRQQPQNQQQQPPPPPQ
jgi:hypothetical protein